MGGRDQPPHERGRAQHVGFHDQQVVVEAPASQPQRIETAPVVLIVDHIPNRQAAIILPDRVPDQLLPMPYDEDSALHPDSEQRIEIPDQEGSSAELEQALGTIPRRRPDAFADTRCQNDGFHISSRSLSFRLRLFPSILFFRFEAGRFRQKRIRSEEHTSELQSQSNLVCRLLLEKKKKKK